MPDTLSAGYAVHGATAAPQIAAPAWWGTLPFEDFKRSPVAMWSGPTGISHHWSELFALIHPDRATTDAGFNRVDAVWVRGTMTISIYIGLLAPGARPLADAVQTIRDDSGLPAADVAAMIGVRRRQLYNLLNGGSASSERERWIGTLAEQVSRLREAAGDDARRVRAAILLPAEHDRSFYDLACERDEDTLRRVSAELERGLRAGRIIAHIQRPSPALRGLSDADATSDFLSGYRDASGQD
jgi:hypothetical protein